MALRPRGAWRAGRAGVWVPVAVAVNAVLLLAAVYLPGLRTLLETQPLTAGELAVSAAAACVPAGLLVVVRGIRRG